MVFICLLACLLAGVFFPLLQMTTFIYMGSPEFEMVITSTSFFSVILFLYEDEEVDKKKQLNLFSGTKVKQFFF